MKYFSLIIILTAIFTLCCGGSGGSNPAGVVADVIPPSLVASFTPDKSSPDDMDVTLQNRSQSGDSITVDVVITGVNDVYSLALDLVYDGELIDYLNFTEGDFLSEGGTVQTSFLVSEQSNRIVIGASRLGQVGGVNTSGDEILMSIGFKVKKVGSGLVTFENNSVLDSSGVTPIQGVEWFGGTASGS